MSFMEFNIQDDTKIIQVIFQFGCLYLSPLDPDSDAFRTRSGLGIGCLVIGKAAMVGPSHLKGSERILNANMWSIEESFDLYPYTPFLDRHKP